MAVDIKIPSVGESVTEALLAEWFKQAGDAVVKDEILFVIETDKVTLEVVAEADGILEIGVPAGETVAIGAVVGRILPQDSAQATPGQTAPSVQKPSAATSPEMAARTAPEAPVKPSADQPEIPPAEVARPQGAQYDAVQTLLDQYGLQAEDIAGSGPQGRLTRNDVLLYLEAHPEVAVPAATDAPAAAPIAPPAPERRERMSPIRKRIAERLLAAKHGTAMLTTFNEIDMHEAMALRARFKERFRETHGVSLGFMSFFVKASIEALRLVPQINAHIDGDDIVYSDACHVGIAVGSERGLVVPVIRNAQDLGFAGIEKAILDFVDRIKRNRLEISELEGGTFTISNGGVYGSLLSTPILNSPQSGILGMHKIEKRPVVVDDQIVIRPMMYVALSYDHRIVDGQGAVTFLKHIKACVENPQRIMLEI